MTILMGGEELKVVEALRQFVGHPRIKSLLPFMCKPTLDGGLEGCDNPMFLLGMKDFCIAGPFELNPIKTGCSPWIVNLRSLEHCILSMRWNLIKSPSDDSDGCRTVTGH